MNINGLISRYQSLSHMQISGPISHMILSLRSNMLSVAYSSLQSERADCDSPPLQFYAPESRQCLAHASRATIANVKSPIDCDLDKTYFHFSTISAQGAGDSSLRIWPKLSFFSLVADMDKVVPNLSICFMTTSPVMESSNLRSLCASGS